MKKTAIFLFTLAVTSIFAVEIDVDGRFSNFRRNWSISSTRNGSAELIPVNGVNYVQISADDDKRGSIGILTAFGVPCRSGEMITVTVTVKGGHFEISLYEYGNKKVTGKQFQKFKASAEPQTYKAAFTVRESATDLVRVAFNVKRGASIVINDVKVSKK
jgi:hypothetical protein